MEILDRIKQLVLRRKVRFTEKAQDEMDTDGLCADDIVESIVNAQRVDKVIRSTSKRRRSTSERLYVIKSFNFAGTLIYTKGTIVRFQEEEVFYVLVSSKIATVSD